MYTRDKRNIRQRGANLIHFQDQFIIFFYQIFQIDLNLTVWRIAMMKVSVIQRKIHWYSTSNFLRGASIALG